MVSLLVVTALLALAGGQQLELQQELHQLRASGAAPSDDQLLSPHEPAHEPRVLPSVVAADHSARTAPPPPQQQQQQHQEQQHHQQQQQRRLSEDQFPRYVEETVDLSAPLDFSAPLELSAPLKPVAEYEDEETWRRRPVQRVPPTTERATERTRAPRPTEPTTVDPRRPTEVSERPTPTTASTGPWLAEEERRVPPPPAPSAFDSSLQLYSDAWDLNAHSESEDPTSAAPVDDSLSALEYELAAYNVTLFDAAMDYLLHDAANLSTLLPEVTKWKGDDANMTRSIAVMDALFTALQARLGDQDSILQRYGLPETSGFNARPVRRTWADANGRPVYRRNRPVVHRFRPHVDERFLGDRASCGSCQFNLMCWMSGGVARGGCGGFMFVCCDHGGREAKSFNPPPQPQVDYGPVRNDPGCGLSDTSRIGIQRRIVGGNQAGFGTFPWQAYILIGTSRCGGSLINRQHVITAGHCVARARPGQITITLGDYVLNSNREPLPAYKFKVRAIQVHPQFQFTPQADRYDVAVLTLDRPVPYAPHIQPICLPEKGEEFEGYYGWAAGWGALRPGSRVRPKELQVVDVPVINRHMCEQWHRQKGINVIIHEEMMCAGYINGGKDSCQGDSGGPLMIESDGRWYLMGIVSAGYSCAQGKQPGIYHRVSMTSDWISYVAGN